MLVINYNGIFAARTGLTPIHAYWSICKYIQYIQSYDYPDNLKFHDGSRHSSTALGMLSVTHLSFFFFLPCGAGSIKLPSAEASKWAQCTPPGQYAPYIKGIMKTP